MPWVRIDDHFNEHPKLAAVGPVGWGIWLAGLAYSNRNLTDGFIPRAVAVGFGGDWCVQVPEERDGKPGNIIWEISRTSGYSGEDMETSWVIDLLLDAGLWELAPGGFYIHDYPDYQPTKAEVLAQKAAKVAAGQAGGIAAAKARAKANGQAGAAASAVAESKPVPVPVPQVLQEVPYPDDGIMEPWQLYEERTHRKASQKVRNWLEDLHVRHSRKELVAAMLAMPDPRKEGWLKLVDMYLEGHA